MTVKEKKDKNYLCSGFHGMLIAVKGYENVIIRDIAKAAVMNVGLNINIPLAASLTSLRKLVLNIRASY